MRVFFYTIKGSGHVNPTLPIVRDLVKRGHEVFYSNAPEWKDRVEELGATFVNTGGEGPFTTANYHPKAFFPLQLIPTAAAIVPRLVEEARAVKPDVIVFDTMAHWGRIVAKVIGCPSVSSVTTLVNTYADFVSVMPLSLDETNLRSMDELESRWGVSCKEDDLFGSYGDDNIVYSCPELNPNTDHFTGRFHFIGSPAGGVDADKELEAAGLSKRREGKKRVYVSMGTVIGWATGLEPSFFNPFIEVFGDRPEYELVMSVGKTIDPAVFGTLPGNVIARQFVPQVALLEHTDLFITHAGANSMHEGLYFGVPLVCIPAFAEQPINARRVAEVGAGVQLDKTKLSADVVRNAVDQVLGTPSFLETAQKLSESLRRAGGARRAIEVLEQVAKGQAL